MRATAFSVLLLAASVSSRADEKLAILKAGDQTYTNVIVTSVSATDVYFTCSGGMGNLKLKTLSPEMQKHFNFDPKKAKQTEVQQAANAARFHEQLLHQPDIHPPDMTRETVAVAAPGSAAAVWRNDFPEALRQAHTDNKLVLLDFTGSDWCPWCIKFDQDVLSTGRFTAYAGQKLELVKVDFPHATPQPDDLKRANAALASQFNVDGYPTYVLVNADGKELGRQVGYREGGPEAFIAELDGFSKH